jgi:transposase
LTEIILPAKKYKLLMNVMSAQAKELVDLSKPELVDIIFELRNTTNALQIQITELKAKGKSSDDQMPKPAQEHPSWVKANKKRRRKKGRTAREENYARPRSKPTKKVFHSFRVCPHCGGALGEGHTGYIREIIEIPLVPVEITHHIVLRRRCFDCKVRVMPQVDFSQFAPGKQRFGVRLTSLITFLREECQQPLPKIQKYLSLVHNLFISQGGIVKLLAQTAAFGRPHYRQLQREIRKSACVYADETGGRENGKNGYHWNFNSEKVQYVVYRRSRKNKIVTHVLGEEFEGVLTSDFYTAYNIHEGFHQRCWVHLTRDIKDLVELFPRNRKLKRWAKQVRSCCKNQLMVILGSCQVTLIGPNSHLDENLRFGRKPHEHRATISNRFERCAMAIDRTLVTRPTMATRRTRSPTGGSTTCHQRHFLSQKDRMPMAYVAQRFRPLEHRLWVFQTMAAQWSLGRPHEAAAPHGTRAPRAKPRAFGR